MANEEKGVDIDDLLSEMKRQLGIDPSEDIPFDKLKAGHRQDDEA